MSGFALIRSASAIGGVEFLAIEDNVLQTTKKGKFLCDGIASDLFLLNLE